MALDHCRLGPENEFLENKSGRIFAFDKFTQQNNLSFVKNNRLCLKNDWIL